MMETAREAKSEIVRAWNFGDEKLAKSYLETLTGVSMRLLQGNPLLTDNLIGIIVATPSKVETTGGKKQWSETWKLEYAPDYPGHAENKTIRHVRIEFEEESSPKFKVRWRIQGLMELSEEKEGREYLEAIKAPNT